MRSNQNDGGSRRHWLDRARPKWWGTRGVWRVRVMRDGETFQWVMKGGKGDSGPTGRAIASAEWQQTRNGILRAENPSGEDFERFAVGVFREVEPIWQFEQSPFHGLLSYDEYREVMERRAMRQSRSAVANGETAVVSPAKAAKPLSELTAIFKAHLTARLEQTAPGLKSRDDISESRYRQYCFALAHIDAKVGATDCEPFAEFHIGEQQLAQILGRYRELCRAEMKAEKFSGHWFNERMKTARMFVSYLVANRLCNATPPNIESLTEKYMIEPAPAAIPLPTLKALWNDADDKFRGYMLLALNCGFRQTEIGGLRREHIKTISGKVCIEKRRGKTGVPIAIPLWPSTQRAIETFGNKSGALFTFDSESPKVVIDAIGNRLKKIRGRVAKSEPSVADYSFENLRDTGASFIDTVNPMLTPLYLGHADTRTAKHYVGQVADAEGNAVVPMQLDVALERFEKYLGLTTPAAKAKVSKSAKAATAKGRKSR